MKRVIIDTDAGVDDALAIILALKSPELCVEAITTVAGNAEVDKCTWNCLLLLDLLEPAHVPMIAQGAAKPLSKDLTTAPEVHGEDGFGNIADRYPSPRRQPVKKPAAEVIIDFVKKYPQKLTILAIGPLTNLAHAIEKDPKTMRRTKEIIAMGGAFRIPGNTGPVAEFNMFVDPDAAKRVLEAQIPLTLLPLDVTEKVVLLREKLVELTRRKGGKFGRFVAALTHNYMRHHQKREGVLGGYLHDPLAVGVAIKKNFAHLMPFRVDVETNSTFTRGMTTCESHRSLNRWKPNAKVAFEVKKREFLKFFLSRISR